MASHILGSPRLAILAAGVGLIAYVLTIQAQTPSPFTHLHDLSKPLPFPLILGQQYGARFLTTMSRRMSNPNQVVFEDAMGFCRSQMLATACKLDVATILGDGGRNTSALALATHSDEGRLFRLMRALAAIGYFQLSDNSWFNTALSSCLRENHPNYVCPMIGHLVEDSQPAWESLYEVITDASGEKNGFELAHGMGVWEYFARNKKQRDQFARAMTAIDSLGWYGIVHDFKWSRFNRGRIVDVGGSLGSLLARIMKAHDIKKGVLFDLPEVAIQARRVWDEEHAELSQRVEIVSGSFFEPATLPTFLDGDVIVLRYILHDWDDSNASRILDNLRSAIGNAKVTLAIVEQVVAEGVDLISARGVLDMHMLVQTNGIERTQSQWRSLLHAAGFKLVAVHPTRSLFSVIEAVAELSSRNS